ncbi:Quinate/shikimate dehydrogenase [Labrenzia sp. THAF82]|uniref:shikimate dehydrogenase n=1 Tax=Labrenzia sp. THAF82 TaxID=2587861 RepID=UPI00126858B5|nr:shikimate dehydrogenase [Labrenzia sp. THAF82]QFT29393.1 Quinate/shikimate dehydrogenase [Labrenzia sp. THAF82]
MRAGLVGSGIGPSLTPELHEREGRAQEIDYRYERFDTSSGRWKGVSLSEILDHAEKRSFAGLNITHPFKVHACQLVDRLEGAAAHIKTVNTILFRDGHRIGHSTDYSGFREAMRNSSLPLRGQRIVQFGAGGAGAATALALIDEKVLALQLVDTDKERAECLVAQLKEARPDADTSAVTPEDVDFQRYRGVVNATPVGMYSYPGLPFDLSSFSPTAWVADIVYRPLKTDLVCAARQQGRQVLDGGAMALNQAVHAFRLLTDCRPDTSRMGSVFASLLADQDLEAEA